jgi:hypothetical protein
MTFLLTRDGDNWFYEAAQNTKVNRQVREPADHAGSSLRKGPRGRLLALGGRAGMSAFTGSLGG